MNDSGMEPAVALDDLVQTAGDPFNSAWRALPHLPPLAADVLVERTHYLPANHGPPRIVRLDVSYVLGLLSRRRIRQAGVELLSS